MRDSIKGIAHRGYSKEAPENTLPAYLLAKEKGFKYVECDIQFTKDMVPVLLHDEEIDRTSNGKGKLEDYNYEDLLSYDFGKWKSKVYEGTKIPRFDEFIKLCRDLELFPYIEIKSRIDEKKSKILLDLVKKYGMERKVAWISFSLENLEYIRDLDKKARLGLIGKRLNIELIEKAKSLETDENFVFLDVSHHRLTKRKIEQSVSYGLPVKVWTVDKARKVKRLLKNGVQGVTSNYLNANDIYSQVSIFEKWKLRLVYFLFAVLIIYASYITKENIKFKKASKETQTQEELSKNTIFILEEKEDLVEIYYEIDDSINLKINNRQEDVDLKRAKELYSKYFNELYKISNKWTLLNFEYSNIDEDIIIKISRRYNEGEVVNLENLIYEEVEFDK